MTDTEEQIADLAAQLNLAPAVVAGVCSELARNPDHAQKLELCATWGIGWPHLNRLEEMRPRNMGAIGKGLAQQAAMLSNRAQSILAKQLNDPATVAMMDPKTSSTIAKQQSDIALSWTKETPANVNVGTVNMFPGGTIQDILALKAMKETEKPALARLLEAGVVIPAET